jgi:hypothetical protein
MMSATVCFRFPAALVRYFTRASFSMLRRIHVPIERSRIVAFALVALPALAGLSLAAGPILSSGEISLPEISGAVMVGDRLLVEADDPEDRKDAVKKSHVVALLDAPAKRFRNVKVEVQEDEYVFKDLLKKLANSTDDKEKISDIEDATAGTDGTLYLTTSHSRNSHTDHGEEGERKPAREHLIRLRLGNDGKIADAQLLGGSIIDALPDTLKASTGRRPGFKDGSGRYTPGFNIEGLAAGSDGTLLFGLRSPLLEKRAVILRLKNVPESFGGSKPEIEVGATLDLEGNGIRGIAVDSELKGYWIIGGLSPDPDDPSPLTNDWSIWFWNGMGAPQKRFQKSLLPADTAFENPEAICILCENGNRVGLLLISDNGGGHPSGYVLLSLESLSKPE